MLVLSCLVVSMACGCLLTVAGVIREQEEPGMRGGRVQLSYSSLAFHVIVSRQPQILAQSLDLCRSERDMGMSECMVFFTQLQ
ncbi:hypothetical protein BDF14DRAFT_1829203 [Spinellus fusiger]|nr:hypothetical protein BDF14DRAFT_1829203 [Spinellus fusiger]